MAEAPTAQRTVEATGAVLRSYAGHFVQEDWQYTRLHDIVHIRYPGDWAGYNRIDRRTIRAVRNAARALVGRERFFRDLEGEGKPWKTRVAYRVMSAIATLRVELPTDRHIPDGVLDGGGVITHWEETGEYLQLVQPSVGALLADFLTEDPANPHAVKIAAEIDRILGDYGARIRDGLVDGRTPGGPSPDEPAA